jgi:CRISPR-associated protein (TIGR03986 family)
MDKIRAPYNFVPVSEHVFFPPWSQLATQDVPFEDGISGKFEIEVTAETPIFVRGTDPEKEKEEKDFFRTADGQYALPGSSLRGMLRNVIEIATFGKLRRVDDRRYGVRDLHNREVYVGHMAAILDGRPTPLVSAGWLTKGPDFDAGDDDAVVAHIEPCDFAKIEYGLLEQLAQQRGVRGFNPGLRQSGPKKYEAWEKARARRDVSVEASVTRGRLPGSRWVSDFGTVAKLQGSFQGQIVFTGQPSEHSPSRAPRKGAGRAKHHDFVFRNPIPESPRGAVIPVLKRVFRDFEFIHSDRGQQHRATEAPNAEWGHWQDAFRKGERVPVFFLLDDKRDLRSFGLAMMFRLAYLQSIREAIGNAQPAHDSQTRDFAETLFGHVPEERRRSRENNEGGEAERALKGRVSIGLGVATGKPQPLAPVRVVLGAPKASYYPNYIEQSETEPGGAPPWVNRAASYMTLMGDPEGARIPRARGWKRYRPQDAQLNPPIPPRAGENVITRFTPLPAGTSVRARVRLHNVNRVELGALLWALRFGGEPGCFHTLGMAKSHGFGRVRVAVDPGTFRCFDMRERALDGGAVDEIERSFVETMEAWCQGQRINGGWRDSMQIFQLLACARPLPPRSGDGRHMMLDHPDDRNEFSQAKKDGLALAPAGAVVEWQKRVEARARTARAAPGPAKGAVGGGAAGASGVGPDDVDRARLKVAFDQGKHLEVLRGWMREAGPREQARKAVARGVVTFISKDMKKNHADVIAWFIG